MNERGFTLIEVMAAMLIFSVLLGGLAPVFVAQLQRNTNSEIRTGAVSAAQFTLDEYRLIDPTTLPSTGTQGPDDLEINGRTYQITTTFCAEASFCASANNRHLTVEVDYRGDAIFSTQTVYTQLR